MRYLRQYSRFFLSNLALGLIAILLYEGCEQKTTFSRSDKLTLQLAYPLSKLDPTIYDDWQTVFVGNHIFRRLVPDINAVWIPSVTKQVNFKCSNPKLMPSNPKCPGIQITFTPEIFFDCENRKFTREDLKFEIKSILDKKNWILPDWKWCENGTNNICISTQNVPDLNRRIKNVYFRFGWSKIQKSDQKIGSGPYCLTHSPEKQETHDVDWLIPRFNENNDLPQIRLTVSQNPIHPFNLALYGSETLLKDKRINIHAMTPLPYYVITQSRYNNLLMPWNTSHTKQIIFDHLSSNKVLYKQIIPLLELAPPGRACEIHKKKRWNGLHRLQFLIPDFIPNCRLLAQNLNRAWSQYGNVDAKCANILDFYPVPGNAPIWDGVLIGLSPGAPDRRALQDQYFSSGSRESWIGEAENPDSLYYLVGMGESLITVDGEKVCGLRPNSMGQANLLISELIPCVD